MIVFISETPDRPGRPVVTHVSANQALVIWDTPKSDGNSDILYYRVDFRKSGGFRHTFFFINPGKLSFIGCWVLERGLFGLVSPQEHNDL